MHSSGLALLAGLFYWSDRGDWGLCLEKGTMTHGRDFTIRTGMDRTLGRPQLSLPSMRQADRLFRPAALLRQRTVHALSGRNQWRTRQSQLEKAETAGGNSKPGRRRGHRELKRPGESASSTWKAVGHWIHAKKKSSDREAGQERASAWNLRCVQCRVLSRSSSR